MSVAPVGKRVGKAIENRPSIEYSDNVRQVSLAMSQVGHCFLSICCCL